MVYSPKACPLEEIAIGCRLCEVWPKAKALKVVAAKPLPRKLEKKRCHVFCIDDFKVRVFIISGQLFKYGLEYTYSKCILSF